MEKIVAKGRRAKTNMFKTIIKIKNLFKLIGGLKSGINPDLAIVTRDYSWIEDGEIRTGKWHEIFEQQDVSEISYNGWSLPEPEETDTYYWCIQFNNGRHYPLSLLPKWVERLAILYVISMQEFYHYEDNYLIPDQNQRRIFSFLKFKI